MNKILIALLFFIGLNIAHGYYFWDKVPFDVLKKLHIILFLANGALLGIFFLGYKRLKNQIGFILMGLIFIKLFILRFYLKDLVEGLSIDNTAAFLIIPYVGYLALVITLVAQKLIKVQ